MSTSHTIAPSPVDPAPTGNVVGFSKYFQFDIVSGFLVFLIALPLCLGIAGASGHPPIAGILTAVVGAFVTTLLSNSELTIKGPAAGLIVITYGCITSFGFVADGDPVLNMAAYKAALAVGAVAGILQIALAVLRLGILQEFFPSSVVHGMLAAIGIIIIAKQGHVLLGVKPAGVEPIHLLGELPHSILHLNPEVALIGGLSLLIMFLWPLIKNKTVKRIPSQMVVVIVAVLLGMVFKLEVNHNYLFGGTSYILDPEKTLVNLPPSLWGAITLPDFTALLQAKAWFWIMLYTLIGSLESLLSAKAIDLLDPWKRKTDFNRDLFAVGVANSCVALIGGLPMISEIVRSKANIDNGARTRFADWWHGAFLLAAVLLIPNVLHRIPMAALAAMLVFTGYRLASPKEFLNVYHIGKEQLVIFVATIVGVLATDLLIGVFIGIGVKLFFHVVNGVSVWDLFRPYIDVEEQGSDTILVRAAGSAVFSNWISFKHQLESIGLVQKKNVVIDFASAPLVDSSVLEKLEELQGDFQSEGLRLEITGLDVHRSFSDHQYSTRRRAGLMRLRRLTVVAPSEIEDRLVDEFTRRGATGFTSTPCRGMGRRDLGSMSGYPREMIRIEVIAPEAVCRQMLDYLQNDIRPDSAVTACVETVEVAQQEDFIVRPGGELVHHGA